MQTNSPPSDYEGELTPNDRLLAALGYLIWVVALVVLLLEETKSKPLLKDHAVQALGFAVATVIYSILATIVFICGTAITLGFGALILWVLYLVPVPIAIYFAYLAYTREGLFEIPYLTRFLNEQGLLTQSGV